MSVLTIISEIKLIHPESVVLVKIGKFYNAYFKDAYIIAHLFGYKLNLSYDKQIINEKKYLKFANKLDDIAKYTNGWIKTIN